MVNTSALRAVVTSRDMWNLEVVCGDKEVDSDGSGI
jgi:hypothetical protein